MLRPFLILAAVVAALLPSSGARAEWSLEQPAGTLADSLPRRVTPPVEPALFEEVSNWSTPRLIVPATQAWSLANIETPVAPASFINEAPPASVDSRITLLSPPEGVRRNGGERRTTGLWAEVETPEWYIADRDWSPHLRHSTRTAIIGTMAGALVANTLPYNGDRTRTVDQQVHDWYQTSVRNEQTDSLAKTAKLFGEGNLIFPTAIAIYATTRFYQDGPVFGTLGSYSDRLVKSYAAGAPLMLSSQFLTGASRPYETSNQSHWNFLNDNNGVSGHAFVGGMPFIVAAQMSEHWALKGTFYAASAMTAWSRVNDGAHFSSQIFLGWSLAYAVSCTVNEQPFYSDHMAVMPLVTPDMTGIAIMIAR